MKKIVIQKTQQALLTFATLALGIVGMGSRIAWENADVISSTLGSKTFKLVETGDSNVDTDYYKSDFKNVGEVLENGSRTSEEVLSEGAVLLKNDNKALPLSNTSKVSLFGTASADPVYGGTGSGGVDTTKAVSFEKAFLDSTSFSLNPTLLEKYKGEWFTKPKGGGWPPKYEDYDPEAHFRRHDSFFFDGSGDKYIGEVPWEKVSQEAGDTFADYGDAAIYVIARVGGEGTDSRQGGRSFRKDAPDGRDGDYLKLNQRELDTVKALSELRKNGTFKKFIVILNGAIVPQVDFLKDESLAIDSALWVGGLGQNGATAVAKILNGTVNPSGKTTDTLFRDNKLNPVNVNFGPFQFTNEEDFASYKIPLNQGNNDVLRPAHTSYVVYQEGMYLGYKYTETRYEDYVSNRENVGDFRYDDVVGYPFGYGLSYTTFDYSDVRVQKNGKTYTLTLTVKNTGEVSGKEAVEVYISKPYGEYAIKNGIQVPSLELVDFGKTRLLSPGEEEKLTIDIDSKYFASYDANNAKTYVTMEGKYYLTPAKSAHDAINNILAKKGIDNEKIVGETGDASDVYAFEMGFDNYTYSVSQATGKPITNLFDFADINKYSGKGDNQVEYYSRENWNKVSLDMENGYVKLELTKQMADEMLDQTPHGSSDYNMEQRPLPTDKEYYSTHKQDYPLEYPTYGKGRISKDETSINLVSMMKDENGREIPLSDPSWDTFMDQLTYDEQLTLITSGQHLTAALPSIGKPKLSDENGPNGFSQVFIKSPNGLAYKTELAKGHIKEDGTYTDDVDPNALLKTSAMPTNGIIAGTFNRELAKKAGTSIGEDGLWSGMSGLYGVGNNIHRTQYQGRAAEYYSEDGFLTGMIAAYESEGIESKGVHVYNKHCALNEGEDTRHGLSTWVNEQAFREIYLRAFEIPITIGGAYNIMASLNRIGTISAPGCTALGEDYLRGECGLKGLIVTDMYTDMTGYRTIAPYFEETYGVYYGGTDIPDGNNIKLPKEKGDRCTMFDEYAPDKEGKGEYARMAWKIREAAKRVCYAAVHSNAMNGISPTTKVVPITPGWKIALTAINWSFGALFIGVSIWTVLYYIHTRKQN